MAGSFEVFRKYQRSMMVVVAILAMLAFFVLPPVLDALQSSGAGAGNPVVATWKGGEIREQELGRALQVRRFVNGQLRDVMARLGFDSRSIPLPGEDEASVVRDLVLASEAEANGIVVDNDAVDRFLKSRTGKLVPAELLKELIAQGLQQRPSVSEADVFESLRQYLAAARLVDMFAAGLGNAPPAARWDAFQRLEQAATIEVVPIVVESLAADGPAPTETELRDLFDRAKDRFPSDRSPEPGFKEPQRISYEWLVADAKQLETDAAEKVTDEEITKFYEENKTRLYVAEPGSEAAPDATSGPAATGGPPATDSESSATTPEKPAEAEEPVPPAPDKPAGDESKPADAEGTPAPAEPQSATPRRARFVPVSFRQPEASVGAAGESAAEEPAAGAAPAVEPDVPPAADQDGEALTYQPLEKVRDDVRQRVANARLDAIFKAVNDDVAAFAKDLSRWRSRNGADAAKPVPPNIEAIAAMQGLVAGRGERRTAGGTEQAGGVGESFRFVVDRRSPMGVRQERWVDLVFASGWPLWFPQETRDAAGNRYLSWKTEDFPEFVPEFDAVRADVERAWRILEARPRAEALAKEIAAEASGGKTLADVVAGRDGPKVEAVEIKPFTWLASYSQAAVLSQPEGLEMPGEDFMRSVFALDPGGTTVAFNEPRTVCYVIRLVSFASTEDDLRQRFLDARNNERINAVTTAEARRAFAAWAAELERRAGLEWKPQPPR